MDDLIRRQDVLTLSKDVTLKNGAKHRCVDTTEINILPSVNVERKKGKWTTEYCHLATYKYCCSECGAHHRARYDYCPSCGADMRGEQNRMNDTIYRQAVKYLDLFTKTYCRDDSITNNLVFRCRECEFNLTDGRCLLKYIAHRLCPDYKDFGSMGDL